LSLKPVKWKNGTLVPFEYDDKAIAESQEEYDEYLSQWAGLVSPTKLALFSVERVIKSDTITIGVHLVNYRYSCYHLLLVINEGFVLKTQTNSIIFVPLGELQTALTFMKNVFSVTKHSKGS